MMNTPGCAGDFAGDDYQCCGSAPALGAVVLRGIPRNRRQVLRHCSSGLKLEDWMSQADLTRSCSL